MSWLFANPWMLAWLPLAGLPILIHLWYRRKYRPMTWAAMEYLLAAIARSSRRMRIEQLLLLLLRIAAVLLVIFALAEPLLNSQAATSISGARTHHVLVLDGSYSMQLKPDDKTLFDLARQQARQVVDNAGEGDAFTLVLMGSSPQVVIGHAAFDRAAVLRELETLAPTDGGADVPAALEAAERLVRDVGKQYRQVSRYHVYFFTDLQRQSWAAEGRTPEAEKEFRQRLERLAAAGALEVVPPGGASADKDAGNTDNLAVERLTAVSPYATTAQDVTVQAVLHNYGNAARPGQTVELLADGQVVNQATVDIPANEATPPISFSYRFQSPGDHVLEVRAAGDKLAIDNQRYLAMNVKEHLTALCIGGKRDATRFLLAALNPDYIRPQAVPESALLDLDLKPFDCIFLSNVGQFTASEAKLLESYLKNGGGLVFFLGDQVSADNYNQQLTGQSPGAARVLPAALGETRYREKYFHFDPLNYRHQLMQIWKANPQAGLLTAAVAKYFQLKVLDKAKAQVALKFDSGDPAIVEQQMHRGRCVLVATAASTGSVVDGQSGQPWTLWPSSGSFPPLVDSLWRLAVGGQIQQRNTEVGQPLEGVLPPLRAGATPTVTLPGGQAEKTLTVPEDDAGRWTFVDTEKSGIYTVNIPTDVAAAQKFAVNVDASEGNLARIRREDLPPELLREGPGQSDSVATIITDQRRFPLHLALLCVVLGVLLTESIVAWRLGNRST